MSQRGSGHGASARRGSWGSGGPPGEHLAVQQHELDSHVPFELAEEHVAVTSPSDERHCGVVSTHSH